MVDQTYGRPDRQLCPTPGSSRHGIQLYRLDSTSTSKSTAELLYVPLVLLFKVAMHQRTDAQNHECPVPLTPPKQRDVGNSKQIPTRAALMAPYPG